MIQILFFYSVIFATVNLNNIVIGGIAFGINSGAYVAEIFRSGIMSVDKGQTEAGRSAATADRCIEILDGAGLREPVLRRLLEAIQLHLDRRVQGKYRVGAVLFSNTYGLLGQTGPGREIIQSWK